MTADMFREAFDDDASLGCEQAKLRNHRERLSLPSATRRVPTPAGGASRINMNLTSRKYMRIALLAILILLVACSDQPTSVDSKSKSRPEVGFDARKPTSVVTFSGPLSEIEFDIPKLQALYRENNRQEAPLVSYMMATIPILLIYPDGTFIVGSTNSAANPSGLLTAKVSRDRLRDILDELAAFDEFWKLKEGYSLSEATDQIAYIVAIRVPGREPKSVWVYGEPIPPDEPDLKPPPAYSDIVDCLTTIRPEGLKPWDPGYVELYFADYGYAPEASLRWPESWPTLDSPLARPVKGLIIQHLLVFPTERLPELDAFLKQRRETGAILIDDWKSSAHYRWSLPGEKKWTSHKQ